MHIIGKIFKVFFAFIAAWIFYLGLLELLSSIILDKIDNPITLPGWTFKFLPIIGTVLIVYCVRTKKIRSEWFLAGAAITLAVLFFATASYEDYCLKQVSKLKFTSNFVHPTGSDRYLFSGFDEKDALINPAFIAQLKCEKNRPVGIIFK